MTADRTDIPEGDSVTLTCSVESSGWRYFWYRNKMDSEPQLDQDGAPLPDGSIRVSEEGDYWCRGGRGNPVYYSLHSPPISISRLGEEHLRLTFNYTGENN